MYRLSEELTIEEIKDSEKILIKKAQQVAFKEEYLALNNGKPISASSKLLGLCPKLDEDGLKRSDSRLQYAEFLPNDVKFLIIHITKKEKRHQIDSQVIIIINSQKTIWGLTKLYLRYLQNIGS